MEKQLAAGTQQHRAHRFIFRAPTIDCCYYLALLHVTVTVTVTVCNSVRDLLAGYTHKLVPFSYTQKQFNRVMTTE